MIIASVFGFLTTIGWAKYYYNSSSSDEKVKVSSMTKKYGYRWLPYMSGVLSCIFLLMFEVNDFPPMVTGSSSRSSSLSSYGLKSLDGLFDAHAIWHITTSLITNPLVVCFAMMEINNKSNDDDDVR
jgi:hypothetical protein